MNSIIKKIEGSLPGYSWFVPLVIGVVLVSISQMNFLLFHTMAELVTVVIAVLMTVVAWQTFSFTRNNFLLYFGSAYLWIGVLDLMHLLHYKGMGVFAVTNTDVAVQYWVLTRYLESFLLVTATWFLANKINFRLMFFVYGLLALSILVFVKSGNVPVMFVEGAGLTDIKIVSEYIIVVILMLAFFQLYKKRNMLDSKVSRLILASIVLTICSELAFTLYIDVYGMSNIIGHLFKFISFWLMFVAMVSAILHEPFTAMARNSSTYDAIPDATLVVDSAGVIHQANQAACILAGVSKDELVGDTSHKWFHGSDVSKKDCFVCSNTREGKKLYAFEINDVANNRWLNFTLSAIGGEKEYKGVVEVIRDITQRKFIEQKLEEVNDLKNSIVENLPAMLFVKQAEGNRYVEWNKAAEEITGLKREEMLGKNDYDFFTDDEAAFYIEMDKKVLSEGKLHDIPEETIHTKYKGVRLLHTRKIPIFNNKGEASYLLGISQDITEQRENEEVLRRSQKMEAVGQLSGGIAHDFNNQLGIVTGYLEFLKEFLKTEEKQSAWVNSARKAAFRCVDLTKQLMLFSRTKSPERTNVDINVIITEMEDIIQKSVTPQVSVVYQFDEKLWPVEIDKGEFEDIVINMVINSRDAMESDGCISIGTSNIYLDDEVMVVNQGLKPGEYVMLEIMDNGSGMSADVVEHIFEPFFTTKAVGSGTGLGMAMVYSFVQRYDGTIKVVSSIGSGTSIRVFLPRAVKSDFARVEIDPERVMVLPEGKERILIVDDELDLLSLAGDYVSSLGYDVYKAVSGSDALEVLSKESIDLVFSDVVMPGGINGYELANKVSELYPDVKVILSSGYIGKSRQTEFKGMLINKPYTRQEVALQIRKVLDE